MTSLFLSYARGDDEPFVRRLHRDLVAAGFQVWFDRESMPSRSLTFQHEVREAVAACDRLLLVVGPHSAASDYLRQEWQFAYFAANKCVNPIVRLDGTDAAGRRVDGYRLLPEDLRLLHAEDFRDDVHYAEHLAQLVRQLSEPLPPVGKLVAVPELPPGYRAQPERLRALRDMLLIDLRAPVVVSGAAARLGLQGMAGIGKSVLANALAHHPEVQRAFRDNIFWLKLGQQPQIEDLQRWLARQLGDPGHFADRYAGKETLRGLLADRAVLLILDDVWNRDDAEAFNIAGPRGRLLLTTRDAGLVTALAARENHYRVELPSAAEAEALLGAAADVAPAALPPAAHQIISRTGRLPLALALCGGIVRAGTPWHHVLEALQEHDLEFLSADHPAEEQHRNAWVAMDISLRALPEAQRERFAELSVFALGSGVPEATIATLWQHTGGLSARQSARLLGDFTQRTLVQRTAADTAETDAAGAITLHDLLHNFAEGMAIKRHGTLAALHRALLDAYRARCPNGWTSGPDDGYFLQKLCSHLLAAGQIDEAVELLDGLAWVAAKCKAGLVFEVLVDYRQTIETLPEAQQEQEEERRQRARLTRWGEELTEYARQWSRRRDIEAQTGQPVTDPEPKLPEPPATCRMWTDEEIAAECTRLLEHPTRLDRLRAFEGFVRAQCYPLLDHGRREGFVGQHALAQFPSGPVYVAGQALLADCRAPLLLRRWPPGSVGNPKPALLATLEGHGSGQVASVSITPDGRRVISGGSEDHTLRVWDLGNGACLRTIKDESRSLVFHVSIMPDGRHAVSRSGDGMRIWNLDSGVCLREIPAGHQIDITLDGRRGWSAMQDWDLGSGTCLRPLTGEGPCEVTDVITPDGRRALSGSNDGTLRVWDLDNGTCLCNLEGHRGEVDCLSVTPDGRRAVSASSDENSVRVWDLDDGVCLLTLAGHDDWVPSVSVTPDGRRAISGSIDGTLRVWDLESGSCVRILAGHSGWVSCVSITPDGRHAVSTGSDSLLRIWDLERGAALRGPSEHNLNSGFIMSGAPEAWSAVWGARVWLDSWTCAHRGHSDDVESVSVTPDGRRAVSCGGNKSVRVWDLDSGACLRIFSSSDDWLRELSITPDGRRAVAGGAKDNKLQVWDLDSGLYRRTLEGHRFPGWFPVTGVRVMADGRRAVSASDDETLRVWDLDNGACLSLLKGDWVMDCVVDLTPDGRRAVASGLSRVPVLQVWDLGSALCPRTIEVNGNHGWGSNMRIMPDGRSAVITHGDHTVRVWDLVTGKCLGLYSAIPLPCLIATGGLTQSIATYSDGNLVLLDLRGISSGPAILTTSNKGRTRCTVCGATFKASRAIVTAIDSLCAHLAPTQSPCLELPESAFSDPRLLSQCPHCNSPVKFNPFFVDAVEDCSVRKPKSEWKRLSDLDPELIEFEHLMRAERFDDAYRLLNEIDREYLSRWGQRALVIELRTRLLGRIGDARLESLNDGYLAASCTEMGDGQKSADCFARLATALKKLPDVDECMALYETVVEIAKEIGDRIANISFLRQLAELASALGRHEKALMLYEQALEVVSAMEDRGTQQDILLSMGLAAGLLREPLHAASHFERAVGLAREIGDRQKEAIALFDLADSLHFGGDLMKAEDCYKQTLELNDPFIEGKCLLGLAILYGQRGQDQAALEMFGRCCEVCRDHMQSNANYQHAYTLAVALLGTRQPGKALEAFGEALKLNGSRMAVQLAILDVEFLQRDRPPLAGVDDVMRILNNALEAASF